MHHIRKNEQGLTHYVLLLFMVLLVGAFAYVGAKRIITSQADTLGDFSYVATNSQAAAQPTARGKMIDGLQVLGGKLYTGYGDYDKNTGPISITPLDLSTGSFAATPSIVEGTEQITVFRVINNKLYVPSIDPSGAGTPSYYAVADSAGSWTQKLVNASGGIDMEHVFDITTLTGTDLWLAGSKGNDAVVYHSTDGGATWTKSLDLAVADRMERFYAIGSYGGKLYVQASSTDLANTTSYPLEASSHVFNGTNWTSGPSLGSSLYFFGRADNFAGKLIYTDSVAANTVSVSSSLRSMTSTGALQTYATPTSLFNYAIDGNTLYMLGTDGKVYSTTDLSNWYLQRTGSTTARSITVSGGQIYIGTNDSKVYKAPVNTSPSPVGSTTSTTTTKQHGNGGTGGGNGHKK